MRTLVGQEQCQPAVASEPSHSEGVCQNTEPLIKVQRLNSSVRPPHTATDGQGSREEESQMLYLW